MASEAILYREHLSQEESTDVTTVQSVRPEIIRNADEPNAKEASMDIVEKRDDSQ